MIMRFSALVAMAKNRVIGKNNRLPWHLPPDLKHFKALTMGHRIIMGRKTYESIGKPLSGRTSIIVTSQTEYKVPGAIVVNSIAEALRASQDDKQNHDKYAKTEDSESFVIGGAEIFRQILPLCDRLYITEIQRDFDGNVLFPEFSQEEWSETSREKYCWDDNGLEYHFVVYDRKTSKGTYRGGYAGSL
jgi:dihydrofolate reductase